MQNTKKLLWLTKKNNKKYNITYTFVKHEVRFQIVKINDMVQKKKIYEKG